MVCAVTNTGDWQGAAARVMEGGRLGREEALALWRGAGVHGLGRLADALRRRKSGDTATYILNRYLNYSNVCVLSCQFCSFARRRRDPDAFEYTIPEMVEAARQSLAQGITEIHMVGGLHPALPFSFYKDLLRELKALDPRLMLKCFTAIEIRHLADRIAKRPIPAVLEALREAGLDALTGGGAEIFDAGVRDRICRGKETAEEWVEVHRCWHGMGGRSTATMLYGHVETIEHRVDHLLRLRELQDETGGFTAFIPYAFEPENNALSHLRRVPATEELRVLALSRLVLDNFDHLTAYWISTGLPLAQVALSYGVDDLHGTIEDERIFHMAGAGTPVATTGARLRKAIREAGRVPRQRDTYYRWVEDAEEREAGLVPA
jgi:aminodeoxyfutalosine synthase